MPGFDGTGPRGRGAMTGGGRGFCAGVVSGGPAQFGRRRAGRGCWDASGAEASGDEVAALKEQLAAMQKRLDLLEKEKGTGK